MTEVYQFSFSREKDTVRYTYGNMRVAVIGPQNTGKSTFVADFIRAFPQFATPAESYRDVIKKNNLSINQLTGTESQRLIRDFIYQQVETAADNTVFDRCLIDNYVYTWYAHTQGNIEEGFLRETENIMRESVAHIDLFLFIPTALSIPLVEDALRDTNSGYIDCVNRMFIQTLFSLIEKTHIQVVSIGGSREERIQQVRSVLSPE